MGALNIITDHEELLADREQAAEMLSVQLADYFDRKDVIILGIPRGGVVIADKIAENFHADIDIVLARKIGAPHNPELALGAVSENGKVSVNHSIISSLGISEYYIEHQNKSQLTEIEQIKERYRSVSEKKSLKGKIVILTDDGVATGATMQAASWSSAEESPARIILALPVAPPDILEILARDVDEVICLCAPSNFRAISQFYTYFEQVDDEQVIDILKKYSKAKSHG
jgi:putative phosphoribosyl transferase